MSPEKFEIFRNIIENVIPFNRQLGLKLLSADDGKATIRFDFKEDLVGNFITRVLHGGAIAE